MKRYRIYGKHRGMQTYKPYDGRGGLVVNLMYAMLYPANKVNRVLTNLNKDNNYEFIKREIVEIY